MKKIAIYAAAALLLLSSAAGAAPDAPIIKTNEAGTVSVTGTLGTENGNEWVSLTVYKTSVGTAGISSQTSGTLNWYDQVKANEKGEYSFSFNMAGEKATKYSFSITTDEISAPLKEFVYYPKTELSVIQTAVNEAKIASDAAAINNVIETYKDYLQFDVTDYMSLSGDGIQASSDQLEVCANILENDISNIDKFIQVFTECSKVKVLNNETDPSAYETAMLGFLDDSAACSTGYFKEYTAAEKNSIIVDMMADDTFKNKSEMVSYLNEKILPKEATESRLWPEMQKLILTMAPEFSIDLTNFNALSNAYGNNQKDVFQAMLGRGYTSCAALISAFDAAVEATPVPKTSDNVSTGSSSSGGGSSMGGLPTVIVPQDAFPDIQGVAWAKDSIKTLFVRGIVSGDENGNFNPDANVTRAQYIKMIISAINMSFAGEKSGFDDVAEDAWYHDYVVAAAAGGLVSGIDENNFGPDLPITRQDAATMIKSAADIKGMTLAAERDVDISDKKEIAEYALESVETLYACNLLNGVGDGRFAPRENMTRAQAAVIISNFLDRLEGLN